MKIRSGQFHGSAVSSMLITHAHAYIYFSPHFLYYFHNAEREVGVLAVVPLQIILKQTLQKIMIDVLGMNDISKSIMQSIQILSIEQRS